MGKKMKDPGPYGSDYPSGKEREWQVWEKKGQES